MKLTQLELSLLIDSHKTHIVKLESRMDQVNHCKKWFDKDLIDSQIERIEREIDSIKLRIEELRSESAIDSV